MTAPTKAQIERARAIYAKFILDNTPGAGPDDVPRFDDNAHGVRIALAALTEAADELIAIRAQVSQLTADLEVAVEGLQAVVDAPMIDHQNKSRGAQEIARATLNTIRKDGP